MSKSKVLPDQAFASDLGAVRHSLLELHTLLLRIERTNYESRFGPVSSGKMLKLLLEDDQFSWLRSLSQLVVRIDVLLDGEEPLTASAAKSLIDFSSDLLKPGEVPNDFQTKYLAALQNEPDVIFAHREAQQALERAKANLKP